MCKSKSIWLRVLRSFLSSVRSDTQNDQIGREGNRSFAQSPTRCELSQAGLAWWYRQYAPHDRNLSGWKLKPVWPTEDYGPMRKRLRPGNSVGLSQGSSHSGLPQVHFTATSKTEYSIGQVAKHMTVKTAPKSLSHGMMRLPQDSGPVGPVDHSFSN